MVTVCGSILTLHNTSLLVILWHLPRPPSSTEPGSKKVTLRPSPGFFKGGFTIDRKEKWVFNRVKITIKTSAKTHCKAEQLKQSRHNHHRLKSVPVYKAHCFISNICSISFVLTAFTFSMPLWIRIRKDSDTQITSNRYLGKEPSPLFLVLVWEAEVEAL